MISSSHNGLRTMQPEHFRKQNSKPKLENVSAWHLWTAAIPRRSITGRFIWRTVWRRWDGHQWIYKKHTDW